MRPSKGHHQAGDKTQHKHHEVQQREMSSSSPGEEELQGSVQLGGCTAGKQLWSKRLGGTDGYQAEHEPAQETAVTQH